LPSKRSTAKRKPNLKKIRLLLTDVDGVLTDGKLYHLVDKNDELVELKGVDTQDGVGLYLLVEAGIRTGVISGRVSDGLAARARMLKMTYIVQGTIHKIPAFEKILTQAQVKAEETVFVGDDLPDIPVMRRAGWSVAPANARPEVKRVADFVTRAKGGSGALREIAEKLLKAQGQWKKALARYEA
jgi:3-deoxy-D-manno-octulosonate 8-phosphate phosphatase (KDO 8-P phosphatase)